VFFARVLAVVQNRAKLTQTEPKRFQSGRNACRIAPVSAKKTCLWRAHRKAFSAKPLRRAPLRPEHTGESAKSKITFRYEYRSLRNVQPYPRAPCVLAILLWRTCTCGGCAQTSPKTGEIYVPRPCARKTGCYDHVSTVPELCLASAALSCELLCAPLGLCWPALIGK